MMKLSPGSPGQRESILAIGFAAAALGCYGAYEQALKTDGGYLTIAAPVVALAAALVPYFAERAWQQGHRIKSLIWWVVLVPVAATLFFATAERVHTAKAGAEAERNAQRAAVVRAEASLADARHAAETAEGDAKAARRLPRQPAGKKAKPGSWCDDACVGRWDKAADAARQRVADAADAVTRLQSAAADEAPLKAPVWLLPASLDLVAFMAIWNGLAMTAPAKRKPAKRRRKAKRKAKPTPPATPVQLRVVK